MSTSVTRYAHPARAAIQTPHSPVIRILARAGLTARGIIYVLIGWVALLVAFGESSRQPSQEGALQLLARQPYGLASLWLLGLGFAGYAIWRLSEAAFGVTGERPGAGPRVKCLGRAAVYAFFAYLTFRLIAGAGSNQARQQRDLTAQVMHHPGGRWVVLAGGLVIGVIGAAMVSEGIQRTFLRYLRTSQMSRGTRRIVERLGVAGTVCRGTVFAIIGVLVVDAAVMMHPAHVGGLDKALLELRHQPYGQLLLVIAALGLITFGVFGLCEARWRRV